jgi:hypothetical protein
MENSIGLVLVVAFPIATLIAAVRAMRRWEGGWRLAPRLAAIAILGDFVFAYVSNWRDPGAHLWPYETMTVTAVCVVFLVATASLRRESLKRRPE